MKNKLSIILFALTLAVSGQNKKLIDFTPSYLTDLNRREFNDKMLSTLFAEKVGTAFGGSNDLSLQKFYASLDANDNSLSVGVNYDSRRGDELKRLKVLFSGGVKIKSKDKFATVYKNGDFQENDIGLTLKGTLIGRGIICFGDKRASSGNGIIKDREESVRENRVFLLRKYIEKVAKFNEGELDKLQYETEVLKRYDNEADGIEEILKKKGEEFYIAMAKEEIAFLEKNKMYRSLWNHWLSLELYLPMGDNNYKTTRDIITDALKKRNFYPFSASLLYNNMLLFSSGESVFLKLAFGLKNNNNIIVDGIKTTPFQTTLIGAGNTTVVISSDDGYKTEYDKFLTTLITIEPSFFTLNNSLGFSPAVEFNQGKYNKTNWKLGIPISLKDKEGKPKVNFEIQWKEVNKFSSSDHFVGISANFLFGDMIN